MVIGTDTDIREVKGVGSRHAAHFASLGIRTAGDLIAHFPYRHEDFAVGIPLAEVGDGANVAVDATVVRISNRRSFRRRRMSVTEARITDGETELAAVWFNQPYLVKTIRPGTEYRFSGRASRSKFGLQLVNPAFTRPEAVPEGDGTLVPVYPLTTGVTQRTLRLAMRAVEPLMAGLPDPLPDGIRTRFRLMAYAEAVRSVHFPEDRETLAEARRRLAFDEIFRLQLAVGTTRRQRERGTAPAIPFDEPAVRAFVAALPFRLTDDQRKAAWEIIGDMGKGSPMNRLLDGDVGSGKTAVAAVAAVDAAAAGFQTAIMAPTEILAQQHFRGFARLLASGPHTVALWTNAYKAFASRGKEATCEGKAARTRLADDIAGGAVDIVIGTHALVQDAFAFSRLGLAVIDEQHRFGVGTRRALREKGGAGAEPHLLSMTATPIPRTLALTVYGDLDISLLKEKPAGRGTVETKVVVPSRRDAAYRTVRERIAQGRQAFFVCPLIDPSDALEATSVTELAERVRTEILPDAEVAVLHGKVPPQEKDGIMRRFVAGEIAALVATSVVEVGVDVPNATVMCVEGAERFGLAQLHQLRGRVGRGSHGSVCFLFPSVSAGQARERLKALEATDDGFALAEKDLRMRGPGDILGEAQSGFLPSLRLASAEDMTLVQEARDAVETVLTDDPELKAHPLLKGDLDAAFAKAHLE